MLVLEFPKVASPQDLFDCVYCPEPGGTANTILKKMASNSPTHHHIRHSLSEKEDWGYLSAK